MEQDGGLAVRVGILLPFGMHNLRHTSQIGIEQYSARAFLTLDETQFLFGQTCLAALLLQDDKVTAHFRPRILREKIVGQTDCRDKAGVIHQPFSYRLVRGRVHNSLRGNECQHTAFTEHIHPLDEKVIVQGHAGDLSGRFVRLAENRVEDGHISERNVAADHIEITSELGFDFLEASDAYLAFGMQSGEHLSRKDVFLKTEGRMPFGCNAVKRADELAQSRRGVEDTLGDDACLL